MMHHNTHGQQGQQKESLVDKAKDMMHMGHKNQQGPYVDPAIPQDKQTAFGDSAYAGQGGALGNTYDSNPGYNTAGVTPGSTQGGIGGSTYDATTGYDSLGATAGTGTGSTYNTSSYASGTGLGTTIEGRPEKEAILDAYGANVTRGDHDPSVPIDPVHDHPAVIGVDAAEGHGAPVIPSTYNVDHTAHTTGPVVGAVDRTEAGLADSSLQTGSTAGGYNRGYDQGYDTTTNTTGSTGTEHQKKGFMANIKEKIHDVTDKMHHKK